MKKKITPQFQQLVKTPIENGYPFQPTTPKVEGSDYSENEIVFLYFVKMFGYSNLFVKNEKHLSYFMGRTIGSVNKQLSNLNFRIFGSGLTDYSEIMDIVVTNLSEIGQEELLRYVNSISDNYKLIMDYLLIRNGKDPKNYKHLNTKYVGIK